MEPEQEKHLQNEFYRAHNIKSVNETALDKTVLALSSGSLILSINFLDKIINSPYIKNIELLKVSWLFLIYSLIAILLGYLFAIHSTQQALNKINEAINFEILRELQGNLWQKLMNICNIVSPITLIIGLAFMARFALVNIELTKSL